MAFHEPAIKAVLDLAQALNQPKNDEPVVVTREMTTDETLKLYNFKAFKKQVYSDLSYDEEQ